LATHAQFSANPDDTFLLTWDNRIGIRDLDRLFQSSLGGSSSTPIAPIDLLVMSACQTAKGDDRAGLGLAGFALRSGARSTIASLWSVSDTSTAQLMKEFYNQLALPPGSSSVATPNPNTNSRALPPGSLGANPISKAEALRQAQLALLGNPLYQHPYFWSAFVLVGNWL
jgi:CHAT domain-containing protein